VGLALWAPRCPALASAARGQRQVSKPNTLITLAPLLLPFYNRSGRGFLRLLSVFVDLQRYELLWLGAVRSDVIHASFTLHALSQPQSDVSATGRCLAYPLIYLLNLLGLTLWIVAISTPTTEQWARRMGVTRRRRCLVRTTTLWQTAPWPQPTINRPGRQRSIRARPQVSRGMSVTKTRWNVTRNGTKVSALAELVEKYRRPLFGFILSMTGAPDARTTCSRRVWLRVIRHAGNYRRHRFRAWLYRICPT